MSIIRRLLISAVMGNYNTGTVITESNALPGREKAMQGVAKTHAVNQNQMYPPFADGIKSAIFGMGCFWGVEKNFWKIPGVYSTQVGYAGGFTKNPSYGDVCSGETGHTEAVRVIFYPDQVTFYDLLKSFWENHDPTTKDSQGNDAGPMYRSAIYCEDETQLQAANHTADNYSDNLRISGIRAVITTEIKIDTVFYYAEDFHQQYLHKNPGGYCSMKGTGVKYCHGTMK